MMRIRGGRAIVTGASSGIGRATAIELAANGCDLVIAARRESDLELVAAKCAEIGVRCEVVTTDVRSRDACRHLVEEAVRRLGGIDLLVNVAGYGIMGTIEELSLDDIEGMTATNYLGTVYCTKAVLPHMLERGSGAIVNVGSITGLMGYAGMGPYGATKFAIAGFTEALRSEVIGRGVRASLVCPATTDTSFFDLADRKKIPAASLLIGSMPPEKVARAVRRAAERGSYRIILPLSAAMYIRFKEIFPRTAHWMMRVVSRMLEGAS